MVQKFVPWSRVGFRNERTRSTLLDPNLMFRCDSYYLGVFGTVWLLTKLGAKRAKVVQKFVPWSRVGIFHNEPLDPPYWTLTSCFGAFCTIWTHLGPFRCLTKLRAKRAELAQKFLARSRIIIFRNEHTWLTPLGPKLMFWCILYYLGAFGTVWLPYKTWCKTSRSGAKVRAMKSWQNFSQRTHPIHPIGL